MTSWRDLGSHLHQKEDTCHPIRSRPHLEGKGAPWIEKKVRSSTETEEHYHNRSLADRAERSHRSSRDRDERSHRRISRDKDEHSHKRSSRDRDELAQKRHKSPSP